MKEITTVQTLAESAAQAINRVSSGLPVPLSGNPRLQLVKEFSRNTQIPQKTRLAGKGSPMGTVQGYCRSEGKVSLYFVVFDAIDILAWAVANGASATIVMQDGSTIEARDLIRPKGAAAKE